MAHADSIANAKADIRRNRLHIAISGKATKSQLERLYTEIRFCSADLQPGFKVISAISQCTVLYIDSLPVFNKIMNYLASQKLGEIVRVTHKQQTSFKQLYAYTNAIQCYRSIDACSVVEAENKLVHLKKRPGLRFQLNKVAVNYESENGNDHGTVMDMSISGCAVTTEHAENLSCGQQLTLTFHFIITSGSGRSFQTDGEVVWVKDGSFAVSFAALNLDRQDELYNLIPAEVSQDLHSYNTVKTI